MQSNFNSDNCLASAATVDYGPFGFLERCASLGLGLCLGLSVSLSVCLSLSLSLSPSLSLSV